MDNEQRQLVSIESLAYGGDGIGHFADKVIFLPDTVPGDVVRAVITEDKGRFFRGEAESIEEPSTIRTEPFCPYADRCGGCQWQMINYKDQLAWKHTIVSEALKRIARLDNIDVAPCIPSPEERGFRTVARYPAICDTDGLRFGYYERKTHRIVDIERCPVATDTVNDIATAVREVLNVSPVKSISEITIRASENESSAVIAIVAGRGEDIAVQAGRIMEECEGVRGLVHRSRDGETIAVYGEPSRFETIGGVRFRINEESFFQINTSQTERLVSLANELVDIGDEDIVVDGFGGVGLFSLTLAAPGNRIRLYDNADRAVIDALYNARQAGFKRMRAFASDTCTAVPQIRKGDVLIVDPPRTGIGKREVAELGRLKAKCVLYVSCNPTTLARDLGYFGELGYDIGRIIPLDMFPHTYHIETVVLLTLE